MQLIIEKRLPVEPLSGIIVIGHENVNEMHRFIKTVLNAKLRVRLLKSIPDETRRGQM